MVCSTHDSMDVLAAERTLGSFMLLPLLRYLRSFGKSKPNSRADLSSELGLAIDPEAADLLSNCFRCLYATSSSPPSQLYGDELPIGLFNSHQCFIIKLIEAKLLPRAFTELGWFHSRVLNILNSAPQENMGLPCSLDTLLRGLPHVEIEKHHYLLAPVVVAHHLLLLQCLLQYCSRNIKQIILQTDSIVSKDHFVLIPALFLNSSHFCAWLAVAIEFNPSSKSRYQRNTLKILQGFIKILAHLAPRIPDLKSLRSCLLIKSIEVSQDPKDIDEILYDPSLDPFIEDLLASCSETARQLRKQICPIALVTILDTLVDSDVISCIKRFADITNTKSASTFVLVLESCDQHEIDIKALLREIERIPDSSMRSASDPTAIFVSAMAKFLNTRSLELSTLSRPYLVIIDKLVELSKDTPSSLLVTTLSSLATLYNVLSSFGQWKRIRNIAHSLYNLGSNHMCFEAWELLIRYEISILDQDNDDSNYLTLQSKVLPASSALIKSDRSLEASTLLSLLLKAKNRTFSGKDNLPYILDLDEPLLVLVVTDCIAARPNTCSRIFEFVSPQLACLLAINLFVSLDRVQDQMVRANAAHEIALSVTLTDSSLSLLKWYHYFQVLGLETYVPARVSTGNPLIEAGMLLWQSISTGWDDETIEKCIKNLKQWLSLDCDSSMIRYEHDIVGALLQYLLYNDFNGLVVQTVKLYKQARTVDDPLFGCLLQSNLCDALLRLGVLRDLSDELTTYSTFLRENRITSLREVIRFNLIQMRFCIASNALSPARQKYHKVLTVLQSRPQFGLDPVHCESLSERFHNLAILAEFNYVSALLSFESKDHPDAFSSVKLAVKLVSSIVKKSPSIPDKWTRQRLQWQMLPIMIESYRLLLRITLHNGLSRDYTYYLQQLDRLNRSIDCPIVNCRINFDLVVYYDLLNDKHTGALFLDGAQRLYSYASVRKSKCIQRAHQQVQSLLLQTPLPDNSFVYYATLNEVPAEELSQMHFSNFSTISDTCVLRCDSLGISDLSLIQSKLSIIKEELEEALDAVAARNSKYATPRVFPCVVGDVGCDITPLEIDMLNRFVSCKEALLNIVVENYHSLSVSQSRIAGGMLNACVQALSTMTVFKSPQTNFLVDLYFLNDRARHHPFSFESDANRNVRTSGDLLPKISTPSPQLGFSETTAKEYTLLNRLLPDSWNVITIDICPLLGDLLLSKICKDQQPFFVSIPPPLLFSGKLDNFESAITKTFNDIIAQLAVTTRSSTTSAITTREQRKDWWKLRFSLDLRMQDLCKEIELKWLGAFSSLFGNYVCDQVYLSFCRDFSKLVATHLSTRSAPVQFGDNVIRFCYGIDTTLKDSMHDMCRFLIGSVSLHGNATECAYDSFFESFCTLCDKYCRWRKTQKDDHTVLVLGPECANLPWEVLPCLESRSVSRVPSVQLLLELLNNRCSSLFGIQNERGLYYMINPDGDLCRTEDRFQEAFSQNPRCHGLIRTKPCDEAVLLSDILCRDLFVFLGHGGCDQYLSASSLLRTCLAHGRVAPPSLLIGCSSGTVESHGKLSQSSNVFNWMICGSPMLLANLWDVTDKDIDQFSHCVFDKWGLFGKHDQNGRSLCDVSQSARNECTLRYLNGASPVVYGLPMHLNSI